MKIRVIVVRPKEKAVVEMIEDKLDTYQELVGGRICEFDPFYRYETEKKYNVVFLCNDDGHYSGYPKCRLLFDMGGFPESVIYGTFVIVKYKPGDENYSSLDDEEIEYFMNLFLFPHPFLEDDEW